MAKTKFYFGYYYGTSDLPWPMKWIEEDGHPIGGKVNIVGENRYEVSSDDYSLTIQELVRKYPSEGDVIAIDAVYGKPT